MTTTEHQDRHNIHRYLACARRWRLRGGTEGRWGATLYLGKAIAIHRTLAARKGVAMVGHEVRFLAGPFAGCLGRTMEQSGPRVTVCLPGGMMVSTHWPNLAMVEGV